MPFETPHRTAESGGSTPRVLFLSGLGRSGTTILERVLGELPGVCSAGELVHLWQRGVLDDELCGCGEPFSRCGFWTEVGRRAFGGWRASSLAGAPVGGPAPRNGRAGLIGRVRPVC